MAKGFPLPPFIHHASNGGSQVLICVDGEGWYQEGGKPAERLHPGDVVEIPANVKHWHGAAADSWFSHLAFKYPGEDASNEWLEPVDDEVTADAVFAEFSPCPAQPASENANAAAAVKPATSR